MCSTPFGITEVGISVSDRERSQRSGCAQRLSASQRWACRPDARSCCARTAVLNAFRHHRGGHSPLPNPFYETPCASGFQGRCRKPAKSGRAWACPLRPTAQFFQGTGVRENHGSSELPRSLKFNPRNLLSGFLGLGPPHSRGCLNCAKRRDWDLGRWQLPCATVRQCHTAPGHRASSGRSGRNGSFPSPPRIGRRGE